MNASIRQHVTLADGLQARTWVSLDYIVVRANGRTCCAHRGWMDDEQLGELVSALAEAAGVEKRA